MKAVPAFFVESEAEANAYKRKGWLKLDDVDPNGYVMLWTRDGEPVHPSEKEIKAAE